MSGNETAGEKSFAPTDKRKADAAKNGDVLRSQDLAVAVAMLVGALWLKFVGPWMLGLMKTTLRGGLVWERAGDRRLRSRPADDIECCFPRCRRCCCWAGW